MAGMFPEITLRFTLVDDSEQVAVVRAAAMVKLERKYGIELSDIGKKMEYFMYLGYSQLKLDKKVNLVFESWLKRVVNVEMESSEMPVLGEGL